MEKVGKGCRLYRSAGDRRRAVALLKKDGFNCFIGFTDCHPSHSAGLSYSKVEWANLFPFERNIEAPEIEKPEEKKRTANKLEMPDKTKIDQLNQLIEITRYGEEWSFKAQKVATMYLEDLKDTMDFAERVLNKTGDKIRV